MPQMCGGMGRGSITGHNNAHKTLDHKSLCKCIKLSFSFQKTIIIFTEDGNMPNILAKECPVLLYNKGWSNRLNCRGKETGRLKFKKQTKKTFPPNHKLVLHLKLLASFCTILHASNNVHSVVQVIASLPPAAA